MDWEDESWLLKTGALKIHANLAFVETEGLE